VLVSCLGALGYTALAGDLEALSRRVQKLRWKIRLATGFNPSAVQIPKRFNEVTTWKGPLDGGYQRNLQDRYAGTILEMGKGD
jgi:aldehyde:ferredoxin oxidoreductase